MSCNPQTANEWDFEAAKCRYAAALDDAFAAAFKLRPSIAIGARVFPDGDKWCALYGVNIQEGVCGFGDTPEKACEAFDKEWKGTK